MFSIKKSRHCQQQKQGTTSENEARCVIDKPQLHANAISSSALASNGPGCNKVAVCGLPTAPEQDEAAIMYPKCQENVRRSEAIQAKKEEICMTNQANP